MKISSDILASIAKELDTGEIKSGSFIERLMSIIDTYTDKKIEESGIKLKNCNIETCDDNTLSMFGNSIGLEKLSAPTLATSIDDKTFFIESPDKSIFPQFLDGFKILSKGQKVYYQKIIVTINSDVYIQSGVSRIYIDCTTSVVSSYTLTSDTLVKVPVNTSYLGYVNLGVSYDINFEYIEESTSSYRLRLISERILEKNLKIDSIKSYLLTIQGINSIDIVDNNLFFSTESMFNFGNDINKSIYSKILTSELIRILPWPLSYSVVEKDKIDLILKYTRYDDSNTTNEELNSTIYDLLTRTLSGNQKIIIEKEVDDYIFQYTGAIITCNISFYDNRTLSFFKTSSIPYDTYAYIDVSNIGVE